jgi:hypothetical protein
MTPLRALAWYRAIYVACIVELSVETALHADSLSDHHFWLAAIEIGAALLLLFRRTQVPGLVLLLLVYALAGTVTALMGRVPAYLLLYAASALLIVRLDRTWSPNIPAQRA